MITHEVVSPSDDNAPSILMRSRQSRQDKKEQDFQLFSHHRGGKVIESYETLKEALLELYLSVKIRSDDEIDNYTEEQFLKEKE